MFGVFPKNEKFSRLKHACVRLFTLFFGIKLASNSLPAEPNEMPLEQKKMSKRSTALTAVVVVVAPSAFLEHVP